jgi:hypothetical protein
LLKEALTPRASIASPRQPRSTTFRHKSELLGSKIEVPEQPDTVGALGAALIARAKTLNSDKLNRSVS